MGEMTPSAGLALAGWGLLALSLLLLWVERERTRRLRAELKLASGTIDTIAADLKYTREQKDEESKRAQEAVRIMRASAKATTIDLEEIARLGRDVPAIRQRMLERFARIVRETGTGAGASHSKVQPPRTPGGDPKLKGH